MWAGSAAGMARGGSSRGGRGGAWVAPRWLLAADAAAAGREKAGGRARQQRRCPAQLARAGQPGMGWLGPPLGAVGAVTSEHAAGQSKPHLPQHGRQSGRGPGSGSRAHKFTASAGAGGAALGTEPAPGMETGAGGAEAGSEPGPGQAPRPRTEGARPAEDPTLFLIFPLVPLPFISPFSFLVFSRVFLIL